MRHRLYLIGIALMVLAAFSISAYAQPFVIPITVKDDTTGLRTIAFGYLYGANPCIDTADHYLGFSEYELPPVPPVGNIDARFKDPTLVSVSTCYGEGSPADFRLALPPGGVLDSFYVTFQVGEIGYPIRLKWPAGLSSRATELRLVDPITKGALFDVNMLTDTAFTFTNAPPFNQVAFFIYMRPIIQPQEGLKFLSLTPIEVFDQDPAKPEKSQKYKKRAKLGKPIDPAKNVPNWSTVLYEMVLRGGFAPGTSESDSAGGCLIGKSFMYKKNPADPLKPKWTPIKELAAIWCWVRPDLWDFKKSIGKNYANLQKALRNKTFNHTTGLPRGLDSTGVPGTLEKRKMLIKQLKKLDPKKTPNRLFAEMVALKVNIAASALGITPAGFGNLIFDRNGHPFDEWSVMRISEQVDSMLTFWRSYSANGGPAYDSAYTAVSLINQAFVGALDTIQFNQYVGEVGVPLMVKGQVNIATVPYMKMPSPFVPTRITPSTNLVEVDEDFEDEEVEEIDGVPVAMSLMQNFPNPFNPTTTIAFKLAEDANVTITVYDMLGREVTRLVEREEFEGGVQTVEFAATGLASGVYFYRVSAENLETGAQLAPVVGKMMLLK